MYLRPGSLFKQFTVERKCLQVDDMGRTKVEFKPTFAVVRGVLSNARTAEIIHWKALAHPVTHTIVQQYGKVMASVGDRLVYGYRHFYVQGVDDPSMLGIFVIYYVEERSDFIG